MTFDIPRIVRRPKNLLLRWEIFAALRMTAQGAPPAAGKGCIAAKDTKGEVFGIDMEFTPSL